MQEWYSNVIIHNLKHWPTCSTVYTVHLQPVNPLSPLPVGLRSRWLRSCWALPVLWRRPLWPQRSLGWWAPSALPGWSWHKAARWSATAARLLEAPGLREAKKKVLAMKFRTETHIYSEQDFLFFFCLDWSLHNEAKRFYKICYTNNKKCKWNLKSNVERNR